jgi:hypothetical protein
MVTHLTVAGSQADIAARSDGIIRAAAQLICSMQPYATHVSSESM